MERSRGRERESTGSDAESVGPPVRGYTWPEFLVECRRVVRLVESLARGRTLEVLRRWLGLDPDRADRNRLD